MAKRPVSNKLKISADLTLGLDAVTKAIAILAQRRKGKTYTANVMAEEFVRLEQPWVALDPTGAWWGLRAGSGGTSRGGLPVYVFGGQHGDLPLERTAGKVIADLVVDQPGYYILDLSSFDSKEAERQFATAFAERLYRIKAKKTEPLHLFVDEADIFVPQQVPSGDRKMLGAFEALVRRGGIRGIGVTMISQRAAVINKNVLEQIDILMALRIVGPNDQKAIQKYIQAHGSAEEQKALMSSLASLKLGEAWFWEPGAEPSIFERIKIRERKTFNSSGTPDATKRSRKAVKMSAIDLDTLRGEIEATIEKAELDDPLFLRNKLRIMEREVAKLTDELLEAQQIETVLDVPVLSDDVIALLERATEANSFLADAILQALTDAGKKKNPFMQKGNGKGKPKKLRRNPEKLPKTIKDVAEDTVSPMGLEGFELDKATRSILTVLLQHRGGREKKQLAVLAGYSSKGGGFNNALSKLRSVGLIEGSGLITTTDLVDTLGLDVDPLPTGEELLDYWMNKMGKAEREILTVLVEASGPMSKDQIAESTESQYNPNGGGFNNALSALRTRDLIEGRGDNIKAAEVLFE